MLFSEPKIPQFCTQTHRSIVWSVSVLFSEPKIPQSSLLLLRDAVQSTEFQCSSASRKFLNLPTEISRTEKFTVSVLFSEPKIPQYRLRSRRGRRFRRFSALQRAENSSIGYAETSIAIGTEFQCSSASRKFLNAGRRRRTAADRRFQCSSASRKFLNSRWPSHPRCRNHVSVLFSEPKIPQCAFLASLPNRVASFSALQRAENSSICSPVRASVLLLCVSVLFSEPKIPQFGVLRERRTIYAVSVLFSEPKIPQSTTGAIRGDQMTTFQCSSASRKFLNAIVDFWRTGEPRLFQCSSASRKFLNLLIYQARRAHVVCFSALQRAENSSMILDALDVQVRVERFSALQRAENSSIRRHPRELAVR